MNTQFENFITTYKKFLKSKRKDIQKAYFFALQSIKSHDIMKFKPKQQIIINTLKNYYIRPTNAGKNELNDLIPQYYIDKDDEIDENNDEIVEDDEEIDDEDKDVGTEQHLKLDKKNGI